MNAQSAIRLLQQRYAPPEWVLLTEVASGTGSHARRYADAIAMNLWPSRGLTLIGFEVKSHRGDWLRELKNPKKVEEGVFAFCDHWYVVEAQVGLVHEGELPETWGLLSISEKKLVLTTPAPPLTPKPISRTFMAAVLRGAAKRLEAAETNSTLYHQGYEAGREAAVKEQPLELSRLKRELEAAHNFQKQVQDAYGEELPPWDRVNFVRALKVAMKWYFAPKIEVRLEGAINQLKHDLDELQKMKRALSALDLPDTKE